jgi:hypothetical protein
VITHSSDWICYPAIAAHIVVLPNAVVVPIDGMTASQTCSA